MKRLLLIILFLFCLCIPASGQWLDSEKMFGQQLNLGHWSTDGLVFYWRGIEAGEAVDESLYRNHGVITGATWVGEGLSFNGTSDYVDIGESAYDLAGLTLVAWVNISAWGGVDAYQHVLSKGNVFANDTTFAFGYRPAAKLGFLYYRTGSGLNGGEFGSGNFDVLAPAGTWHQIVGVLSSTIRKFYLDGRKIVVSSDAGGGALGQNAFNARIGGPNATTSSSRYFEGQIRDVSIYNRALNASEIQQLYINPNLPILEEPIWSFYDFTTGEVTIGMIEQELLPDDKPMFGDEIDYTDPLSDGLVAYYPFVEAGELVDFAGENDGEITGATWVGGGLRFDATDTVDLGKRVLDYTQPFTIIASVNPETVTGSHQIVTTDHEGQFRQSSPNITFFGIVTIANVFVIGTWLDVAVTFDGTTWNLYADGILGDSAVAGAISQPSGDTHIGTYGAATEPFSGTIKDVKIYQRALNASEIKQLYRNPNRLIQREPIWSITGVEEVTDIFMNILNGNFGPSIFGGSIVR